MLWPPLSMPSQRAFLMVADCFIWALGPLGGLVSWMPLNALQPSAVILSLFKGCWLEEPRPSCEVQKVLRILSRPVVMI
jgi:hypothetical protein